MALRRREPVELDLGADPPQLLGDQRLLVDGVEHVGLRAEHQRTRHLQPCKRSLQRTRAMFGEVELVHRARQVEVAVGVVDLGEALALVLQVGLHLELRAEVAGHARSLRHAPAAEALVPFFVRAVGDRAELAREPHALARTAARLVVAAAPGRIVAHDLALQRAQRDRERIRGRRAGNRDQAARDARKLRGEGEHGHAAHRRSRDAGNALDAQRAQHLEAAAGHVLERDFRKADAERAPGARIDRRGARGAVRAADGIDADDEVTLGVDRPAGTDHLLPPARLGIRRRRGRVGRGRETGEEQERVVACVVQLAPGLVGDDRVLDRAAAVQQHWLLQQGKARCRQVVGSSGRCAGDSHEHACSLDPAPGATSPSGLPLRTVGYESSDNSATAQRLPPGFPPLFLEINRLRLLT